MTEFDPERLLRTLAAHEVEFCVVGAMAAWLQGSPTVTLDLDVMPKQDLDNADRLAAALNELGARSGSGTRVQLEGGDFVGWQTHRFDTEAGPIDVVPHAAGIGGYDEVASIPLTLGDLTVRAITIDEVIASKESLGRPKDVAALPALYTTRDALRRRGQAGD